MEQAVATGAAGDVDVVRSKDLEDFVTFFINNQMFGIPVLKVQDILTPDRIAPIPLTIPCPAIRVLLMPHMRMRHCHETHMGHQ